MSTVSLDSKTMPSKPNSKIDFRDLDLKNQINSRYPNKSEGLMAKRDLKRYYHFISETLEELNFGYSEAYWIVECFKKKENLLGENEELLPIQNEIVAAVFLNRINVEEDSKDIFLEKVKNWKPYQTIAISDAVERFWDLYNAKEQGDTYLRIFRAVGLTK
jgi:hypothetical protein